MTNDTTTLTQQVEEARETGWQHLQEAAAENWKQDGEDSWDNPDLWQRIDRLIALERAEAVWIQHQPDCSFTFDNCERVADVVNAIAAIMEAP